MRPSSEILARVRKMGARVHLLTDGDVAGAITAARRGTGVDLLYGIGGTPEGVVAAAALIGSGNASSRRSEIAVTVSIGIPFG